jgi:hypothetical protein
MWRCFIQMKPFVKYCLKKRRVQAAQLTNVNDSIRRIGTVWTEICVSMKMMGSQLLGGFHKLTPW